MPAAHSDDLRERVVAAVAAGCSRRAAAERFQVGVSSAIRWTAQEKATGTVSPKPARRRDSPLEPHAAWLLDLVTREPFLTLAELEQRILEERGLKTTERSIRRCFRRHRINRKKNRARQRAGSA